MNWSATGDKDPSRESKGKARVGVVFGGRSGEHEVSLMSAQAVMAALEKSGYEVVPLGITREGKWVTGGNPMRLLEGIARGEAAALLAEGLPPTEDASGRSRGGESASRALVASETKLIPGVNSGGIPQVDVIFPVLHGPYGEDGTIQGMLELAGVPYVGSGVLGSALAMDKAAMKAVFKAEGFPTPKHVLVMRADWQESQEDVLRCVQEEIDFPCFVKPANLGSSVGVTKVRAAEQLAHALDIACRYDRRVIVEQAIPAREVECSVLGNDRPIASLPGEIVPHREFYDYVAKYIDTSTEFIIPANLPAGTIRQIQDLAVRGFIALDCAGMARADFFVDRLSGQVYINELNTIPGFTNMSMYPKMWEASGISFPDLVDRLVQLALERHEDRARASTSYRTDDDEQTA